MALTTNLLANRDQVERPHWEPAVKDLGTGELKRYIHPARESVTLAIEPRL